MLKFLWSQLVFWDRKSLHHSSERHTTYNCTFFSKICVFSCDFAAVSFRMWLSSQKKGPSESLSFKTWIFFLSWLRNNFFLLFVKGSLKCHSQEKEKQQHQEKNREVFSLMLSWTKKHCTLLPIWVVKKRVWRPQLVFPMCQTLTVAS